MLGCSTGRNRCSLGMQGPLRGTLSQSMGTSSHVTCTGLPHSSLGFQVKHAPCCVANHWYVITLHTQRSANLFLHLQSQQTEQRQQKMVLSQREWQLSVLTKAGKVRGEADWNLVCPVLQRGRNNSLQGTAHHCSLIVIVAPPHHTSMKTRACS